MNNSNNSKIISGVEQDQRLLPALEEGYFNVDEMSFEDLLSASVEFASSLNYYNANLQVSGDWRSFLASNEIAIMALIINKDVEMLRKKFLTPGNKQLEALTFMLIELLMEFDRWLVDLKRSSSFPARELSAKFELVIHGPLIEEAHNLGVLLGYLQSQNDEMPGTDLKVLSDIWKIYRAGDDLDFPRSGIANIEDDEAGFRCVSRASLELLNAIESLKSHCRILLPESLKTQSHDPAVSLFVTFLKLYKYAQENINTFTQRHLDFYYQEILKTQYKNKTLETVILNFSIADGDEPIEIEKGREFTCARDKDHHDVIFRATENLTVSDAQVTALYSLRFDREQMITPACDMNFITRVHKQKVPLSLSEQDISDDKSWPLFGDGVVRRSDKEEIDAAPELGVAVASKILFLDEGDRKISLDLGLTREVKPISSYVESLEQASNRAEFKFRLFELMLAWIGDQEHKSWHRAVSVDLVENLKTTAQLIDLKDPPLGMGSSSGNEIHLATCKQLLNEGLDRIEDNQEGSHPYYFQLMQSENKLEFINGLGALVIHFLLEGGSAQRLLDGDLDNRAIALACENSLDAIKAEVQFGRERLFKKYFGTAFVLYLSTDQGWFDLDRYDVVEAATGRVGFKILLNLSSDAPSITRCLPEMHGDDWDTELPILKLAINPEASLNVYSLLEVFSLDRISISAEVYGARNIVAYNNISQLDPSKPFYPFGSMPTTSSYFAFAAPEAAKKNIDAMQINLHWGDLPQGEEGFNGHYENYPGKYRNQSFTARINVLNNGTWQPISSTQIQTAALFDTYDKKLKDQQTIDVEAIDHLKPISIDLSEDELDLGLKTRNGFIKLTLASPDGAFGHQEYPLRLSETIESNAKKSVKKKGKLPKSPYTPLLNKVSIDYIASSSISLRSPSKSQTEKYPEKIYRLHAMGVEKIYPGTGGVATELFKPFNYDGNLLLGLSASNIHGMISFYFSLSDDSERVRSGNELSHSWSYLSANGWTRLRDSQIVSDGTKGFLCSGIVTIEMPRDIAKGHSDMPGDCYWLKVASDAPSTNFCSLRRVRTHALTLSRSENDSAEFSSQDARLTSLEWQPLTSIPGLDSILQPDGFTDIGKDETRRELVTRISERIRHRSRAVLPWDYERLILEKFPIVGKVMCLPNRSSAVDHYVPGQLLVVVTPKVVDSDDVIGKTPKLSAVYLNDIHEYVSILSSAFATIEVTNPTYEWAQIRCSAVFEKYARGGIYIDRLNTDIGRYLNPWSETGYGLKFCEPIRREDVYSYIYNLDYIKYVTDFSMLHITRSAGGFYRLDDSVHNEIVEGATADVTPNYPWSLIVPLKRHYIEVSQVVEPKAPDITGIRELEIGSTFIVSGV